MHLEPREHARGSDSLENVCNGALENKNLEHFDPCKLLENLEDWERYLQSDQELIEKLRSLERHSSTTAKASVELRGPRP